MKEKRDDAFFVEKKNNVIIVQANLQRFITINEDFLC